MHQSSQTIIFKENLIRPYKEQFSLLTFQIHMQEILLAYHIKRGACEERRTDGERYIGRNREEGMERDGEGDAAKKRKNNVRRP